MGDLPIAALAGGPIVENAAAQGAEVAAHQQREGALDGREIFVGCNDREEGIGPRGQVGEMVGGRGRDKMEVAIDLLAITFRHHRFESCRRLFEGRARLGRIAAKLAKAQAKAKAEQ